MTHPFRFAAQLAKSPDGTATGWAEQARKAEDLGYSALLMPDHFDDQLAPVPALMAAADATTTLRVGALVFDNDYRHPLVLAKEAATIDVLSGGRLELGLGAGWMRSDYEQSGIAYDPPSVRIDRFEEGVAITKGLLSSEDAFSFSGTHYTVTDHAATPRPVQRPHPPITIGGGGKRILTLAARYADVVGINVDLRAGTAGVEAAPNATPEATRRKVQWVREAAGDRFDSIELNTLVGFVMVTDDRAQMVEALAPSFGLDPADAVHVPLALIGTLEEMEEELQWRRENYGISYFSLTQDAWELLAPVVARLAGK
jgi:probable F420-dependent oxidoreductase